MKNNRIEVKANLVRLRAAFLLEQNRKALASLQLKEYRIRFDVVREEQALSLAKKGTSQRTSGPYSFVIQGKLHYYFSSAPEQALRDNPRYLQIYFYSEEDEQLGYRLNFSRTTTRSPP